MTLDSQSGVSSNRLLATLSPAALRQMGAELFDSQLGEVVQEPGGVPSHVVFPNLGTMISVLRTDSAGGTVEVGIVGGTGGTPIQSVLASLPTRSEAIAQVPGLITRVPAAAVRKAFAADEKFRQAVLMYQSVYLDEISQNAICNRLHSLEARLAKWLIASRQYTGTNQLTLTHEFLSHMLGVRRAGVTVAVNDLALAGLISHTRREITIVDPDGLQGRACECEQVLREGWERLMKL